MQTWVAQHCKESRERAEAEAARRAAGEAAEEDDLQAFAALIGQALGGETAGVGGRGDNSAEIASGSTCR